MDEKNADQFPNSGDFWRWRKGNGIREGCK